MGSLLNEARPPVFCPGCSHDRVTHTLARAFQGMNIRGDQVALVSDIGCSGLLDTFFHTHALHGLHGRALTYASGLKLARPELTVVVAMGDGGQGIGGAHLLAASRRNLDLTLLILNNFTFGMTGGQYSVSTPSEARIGSGFLNQLERPLDICQIARSAGAPYVKRCSAYQKDLAGEIQKAIEYKGFSVLDIWGICPGRYAKHEHLTPKAIDAALSQLPATEGVAPENVRQEYSSQYRMLSASQKPAAEPVRIEPIFTPPEADRQEVLLLGSAGQRIITAGEVLSLAALTAGLYTTLKYEHNITVLRGPSIGELIVSPERIDYTGVEYPRVIVALAQEGVDRRAILFDRADSETLVLQHNGVQIPECRAQIHPVDLTARKIRREDWALASLGVLAEMGRILSFEMLEAALRLRFTDQTLQDALVSAGASPRERHSS